ncbi:hypothetical protein C8A03DRAFT_43148 [Achaetomium macrosporum]|uniref:F-box domain-containing protein n=1 Tax=Achaetomium macrosporum TaxID=79813 RepID=A0AAN7CD86_9PEZI|nr:hypothetical protein C8A03DRAFT_43148 [Achaetomium macrosporum]
MSNFKPMPHLPPEIWMIILEHLPASFFQRDIRRLFLCKSWYSLAFPAFYPRIEYTPRVISRLVHRKSPSLDRTRALLRKSLRCVNIVLDPGLGWCPPPGRRGGGGGGGGRVVVGAGGDPKTACFNTPSNLTRFGLMLLEFRELKAVRFTARWPNREWRADPLQASYLNMNSLHPYISPLLTHVTSLDLDLCGTDIVDDAGGTVHFCWHVRPLLSRLRSLRLRMRRICHKALWPLENQPVTLGELSLNLYLGRVSDHNPKLNSSLSCSPLRDSSGANPMDEMRGMMKPLVREMVEPRRAEIVHLAPNGEVHIWDASTDVCVRDPSEKPRRFPMCFDMEPGRPCFSESVDGWDGLAGAAGMYSTLSPGELSDGGGSEEPEEPEEPEEMEGVVELDGVEDVGVEDTDML